MIVLLGLHAVLGILALVFARRLGRRAIAVGLLGPLASLAWLGAKIGGVLAGQPVTERVEWIGSLDVSLALRLDGYAALFSFLVAGIGVLVFVYAGRYLPRQGVEVGRLAGFLTLFAGSMLGLVLADDLFALYGFWELTSITSYLLIGNDHDNPKARAAALQALLVTSAGALAMLAGFVLLGQAAGTYRVSELLATPPSGAMVAVALALVLVGAFAKSAQYPFHSWLPAAMAAPTPVSAYLHSATMVKAGVLLVGRFTPAFSEVGLWRPTIVTAGLFTMVAGGLRALRQHDLKLLLAFGTVSQLGFMMVLFGLGTSGTFVAACVLVLAHGLFKAALFMVVGMVDHQAGTRDLRALPGFGRDWLAVKAVAVVGAASMAGVPLAFGFVAKEEALAALFDGSGALVAVTLVGVIAGSILTAAYSLSFAWAVAGPRPPGQQASGRPPAPPASALLLPAATLAAATVILGVFPALSDEIIGAAAAALDPGGSVHLALWHGFAPALGFSGLVLGGGAAVFAARARILPGLAFGSRLPSGNDVFLAVLRALNRLADRTTAIVQSGSLPIYAGVILATTAIFTGGALLAGGDWPGWPEPVGSVAEIPVVIALVTTALAAAVSRRRFSAALFLGATGYAMAGLFVVRGAPDLALTQAAIETLGTVLFVLVLRRLPGDFTNRAPAIRQALRAGVAGLVAATVFAFAITASGSRVAEPVSGAMVDRALPDGGGRNVVNVILVDFRGLDTFGEITVLAAAAIGVVALARAGRRPRRPSAGRAARSPVRRR